MLQDRQGVVHDGPLAFHTGESRGARGGALNPAEHHFDEARALADEWPRFSEAELESMLEKAGFTDVQASIVEKESETPQFQTLLATATRSS